jgi:uncharacterized protein (DUF952 family)
MMTKILATQALLDSLAQIRDVVGAGLDIDLTEQDFTDVREELQHIYCHETCHAALAHQVPWLRDLPEDEHTMVDETLARFLEKVFAPRLGLFLHSDEEFLVELSMYPAAFEREAYLSLSAVWKSTFWPRKNLAGMAVHTLLTLRHGDLVYHILPRSDWKAAKKAGSYRPASLARDGFIHFSRVEQVLPVARNFYQDAEDLLLLTIATEKVAGEIRYEDLLGEGKLFPHLYGPLDLSAVVAVDEFGKDEAGAFVLPQSPPKGKHEWKI